MPFISDDYDSWTKKDLKAECLKRGISCQGLRNKRELMGVLHSHHVNESWTKKELKAECGRRGLRSFSHLTKDCLIQLLNHGTYSGPPDDDAQAESDGEAEAKASDGDEEATAEVDVSWTKKGLKAECSRRGLRGFSNLTKGDLIQLLNHGTGALPNDTTSQTSNSCEAEDDEQTTSDGEEEAVYASWTKKKLLEECRRRDYRYFMYLTKAELIKLLNAGKVL